MTDMSASIAAKSDQLNADDLIGKSITIKITNVKGVAGEQPIAINYDSDGGKPYMPCKSMRRVLVGVWGIDGKKYIGKSMTLYRDDTVMFGGMAVGGIRISHMSDLTSPKTLVLTATKKSKKPFTVQPLKISENEKLKEDGDKAAAGGKESYQKWKDSLAPEIKEKIKPYHGAWVEKAMMVEKEKTSSQPEILDAEPIEVTQEESFDEPPM